MEIDSAVAALAAEWFGFVEDERMTLHIADGVDHVKKLAKEGEEKLCVTFLSNIRHQVMSTHIAVQEHHVMSMRIATQGHQLTCHLS